MSYKEAVDYLMALASCYSEGSISSRLGYKFCEKCVWRDKEECRSMAFSGENTYTALEAIKKARN
jgi:hypothetical protein